MKKIILITGCAGFIGMNLCIKLLQNNQNQIIGIDNINDYYDVDLKKARLRELRKYSQFTFYKLDITQQKKINILFKKHKIQYVVHLAAQAGVRYSLKNPKAYLDTNISGFFNIIDQAKENNVKHFIYASSSSVYGLEKQSPFNEKMKCDTPASLYAATKKCNENIAHTYSHLYKLPTTGLRFFTVYGPWGRPDMALFLFADAISKGTEINLYNNGNMYRDFTFIDDVVTSINRLISKIPGPNNHFFRVLNIGNSQKIKLKSFLNEIESVMGKKTKIINKPIQPGDVKATLSDSSTLSKLINYYPSTTYKEGIKKFIKWYTDFYH